MTIGLDLDQSEMNQFILNSAYRPRRKVQQRTPKGGCKVTGNEERNQLQDYEENPFNHLRTTSNSTATYFLCTPFKQPQ